jgi:hypothetical protein
MSVTRVLVDHSVRRNAIVGQWTARRHSSQWGNVDVSTDVAEFVRRPLPSLDQAERISSIIALPTLRRLAKQGVVALLRSRELDFEGWTGCNSARGTVGDLLGDLNFEIAASPVERSFFHQTINMDAYLSRDNLREFCKLLLRIQNEQANHFIERMPLLPESSGRGLRDLERCRRLFANAPDKHYPDLFHWWTAEHAGCEYYLTMDGKFINYGTSQCKDILSCGLISPSGLLEALGIAERDPMPFEMSEALSAFDAVGVTK